MLFVHPVIALPGTEELRPILAARQFLGEPGSGKMGKFECGPAEPLVSVINFWGFICEKDPHAYTFIQ